MSSRIGLNRSTSACQPALLLLQVVELAQALVSMTSQSKQEPLCQAAKAWWAGCQEDRTGGRIYIHHNRQSLAFKLPLSYIQTRLLFAFSPPPLILLCIPFYVERVYIYYFCLYSCFKLCTGRAALLETLSDKTPSRHLAAPALVRGWAHPKKLTISQGPARSCLCPGPASRLFYASES